MPVTIKEIARICGVSYSTVSRALNDYPLTNEETKKKVLETARALGYTPNDIARRLVTQKSDTVGLIVPDISNPYFPEVAKGVADTLGEAGYHVFLCNADWQHKNEIKYRDILLKKRVAGLIVSPSSDVSGEIFENIYAPVVFIGSKTTSLSSSYVSVDNKKGAHLAMEYLISLGHKKIACIQAKKANISGHERLQGYYDAIKRVGITVTPEYIKGSQHFSMQGGYYATLELLNLPAPPTAIVAFEDILALGVIEAVETLNKKVPDDMSVIGFDDIIFAGLPKINLTSVFQPKYKAGATAAKILLERIKNPSNKTPVQITLEPELIKRGTCERLTSE